MNGVTSAALALGHSGRSMDAHTSWYTLRGVSDAPAARYGQRGAGRLAVVKLVVVRGGRRRRVRWALRELALELRHARLKLPDAIGRELRGHIGSRTKRVTRGCWE